MGQQEIGGSRNLKRRVHDIVAQLPVANLPRGVKLHESVFSSIDELVKRLRGCKASDVS